MRRLIKYITIIVLMITFTQCKDYLSTSSPSNTDNEFVTTTTTETFKTLSWCYANFRQNCLPLYRWNDPVGSDAEVYPEANSTNNLNATLHPEMVTVDAVAGAFNGLYTTLARADKIAGIISGKAAYKSDIAAGKVSDWTQLYGEAITMKALCYFELVKHFGDVPFGYENTVTENFSLDSRFDIYDHLIASLKTAEPSMYKIGEGSITAERFSRPFCDALIGEIALYAGGYQTLRTDVDGLYGNVQFTVKGVKDAVYNCEYARRSDYLNYYQIADQYLQASIDNEGTAHLITTDERTITQNPFQRHFQYFEDLQVSPESLFEIANIQGGQSGQTTTSEYPYSFGRPSNGGGSNAAPCKSFNALRIVPTVYYGEFVAGDRRRDVSVTVTGSNGDGNEAMLNFLPGSKLSGGISSNKWDENRMNPPYVAAQRQSGINWPFMRMADAILMLAEAKAELGEDANALNLVNQIRERAFGNNTHDLSGLTGDVLKEAILQERKLELLGEGTRRWDMILSGEFSERAIAVQSDMAAMISDLKTQGYHQFANGNVISSYIFTKAVKLTNPLTYEAVAKGSPDSAALYPGWRGQYDYTTIAAVSSKVKGTTHNISIDGLFRYIDPAGSEATGLVAAGYKKTNWGIDIVNNASVYAANLLSGITSADQVPRYYWPIPSATISQSQGKITNGYGLPQQ